MFLLAGGCGKQQPAPAPYVAKVGDASISPEELKRELSRRNSAVTTQQREAVLQEMIRTEALYQRAKESGLASDPEIVARIKRLVASAYDEKARGPEEGIKNTQAELDEYYAMHSREFGSPEKVRVAGILLRVPKKATEEKQREFEAKATALLEEARKLPANVPAFGEIAREASEDQVSRYQGGDMGAYTRSEAQSRWGADVTQKLFALKQKGELLGPVKTDEGLVIFKLIDREDAKTKPLSAVKELVAYRVTQEKKAKSQGAFEEKFRSGLKIEINRPLADSLVVVTNAPETPPSMPGR